MVEIVHRSIPVYATLNYDGRAELEPTDPLDAAVVAAMNAHQRTDKGFGPALGPMAAPTAIARLQSLEYSVAYGTSDWVFGPEDREIQMKVLAVWASAANRISELSHSDRAGWLTRRRDAIIAGRSSIRIGHVDLFATPIGTRGA